MAQDSVDHPTIGGTSADTTLFAGSRSPTPVDFVILLLERWRLVVLGPLCAGLAALGITYLIAPTFTARTVFLPPQQQQSLASSALASLGALSGLAGGAAGIRNPIDQYVALLQSATVADRVIDKFELMRVYDRKYRMEARKDLAKYVRASSSRIGSVHAEPGDTLFVPEEMDKTTFIQSAKDWTQILYQFGIGIAGLVSALK